MPLYQPENTSKYFYKYFQTYLLNSTNINNPVRHISLNPNPVDKIDDLTLLNIAKAYMKKVGFKNQPYIVYKHFDLQRIHIHIVSVSVNENGYQINYYFDFLKAQDACKEITKEFNLTPYNIRHKKDNDLTIKVVDYREPNLVQQMYNVVEVLTKYYNFENLKQYNAVLNLFKVKVALGKNQDPSSIVYYALDLDNNIASNPISPSRLCLKVDMDFLNVHFKNSSTSSDPILDSEVKKQVESYFLQSKDYKHFNKLLKNQGINLVSDNKNKSDFYFVSHKYKRVFTFKDLDKRLSERLSDDLYSNFSNSKKQNKKDPLSKLIAQRYNQINDNFNNLVVHSSFDFVDNYFNINNKAEFVCFFNHLFNAPANDLDQKQLESLKKRKRKKKGYRI
ncbi:relaxase/mobilization nuclease domain-containing protein [Myroides sp. M-43]|uniref:relaxase/mobilization nuclease domain-containing protein n=1 Tax=Myroides oncorhynchi TaxID=2893756 RepID=UPI001E3D9953|nr:relaxase/mobilization nuclease domain-containing protein [Myroides oncorhynchi]MCC9043586.1 relaxase/mobilization nuclease domain-containing protein [Myroides oncorhynchi]